LAILGVLQLLLLAAGCVGEQRPVRPTPAWPSATRERPQPRLTPVPVVTLRPTPVPLPTLSPLQFESRGLATPEAPTLIDYLSEVTNERCLGECLTAGNSSLYVTDFVPYWTHPDPVNVDYFEVWRATSEYYWDIGACTACALVATSTGFTTTITSSPPAFNPVVTMDGNVLSEIDVYRVRAVNGAGASAQSGAIGVVHYSLLQAGEAYPGWPLPTPTYVP
jgi:hypothetical protein